MQGDRLAESVLSDVVYKGLVFVPGKPREQGTKWVKVMLHKRISITVNCWVAFPAR